VSSSGLACVKLLGRMSSVGVPKLRAKLFLNSMKMLIKGDHLEITRMAPNVNRCELLNLVRWLRNGSRNKDLTDYQLPKTDSVPCNYYLFPSFTLKPRYLSEYNE
jgi:hypothetical protein